MIKGYLPVRLRIPASPLLQRQNHQNDGHNIDEKDKDYPFEDTFFYIREHRGGQDKDDATNKKKIKAKKSSSSSSSNILFVANAPVIPGVSTKILLQSLFGRFATVSRVTVVSNPRQVSSTATAATTNSTTVGDGDQEFQSDFTRPSTSTLSLSLPEWTPHATWLYPTFLPPLLASSGGKYAHVVFVTSHDRKQAQRALEQLQLQYQNHIDDGGNNINNMKSICLELDAIEIQTLADKSLRQWQENRQQILTIVGDKTNNIDDDDAVVQSHSSSKSSGVLTVAKRYRDSLRFLSSRQRLLQECNRIMEEYEQAEAVAKQRDSSKSQPKPDDDGFITVSYNNAAAVGSKTELEQPLLLSSSSLSTDINGSGGSQRKSGHKRKSRQHNSTTKKGWGAQELPDFYRFQKKQHQRQTMDELRQQFQQDLQRVQRLKEEKQYRPF
jgi:ribosomal RNA-processing protein 7